jgi:hypothetical protein
MRRRNEFLPLYKERRRIWTNVFSNCKQRSTLPFFFSLKKRIEKKKYNCSVFAVPFKLQHSLTYSFSFTYLLQYIHHLRHKKILVSDVWAYGMPDHRYVCSMYLLDCPKELGL